MSAFRKALDEMNERVEAVAGVSSGTHAEVVGNPERLIRAMLSGYLPVDETDSVMEFLGAASANIQSLVFGANSPTATDAGVRFTVAQMIVVGSAIERQHTAALRKLERAARRYFNEFDPTLGNTQYVERVAMREALAEAKP